MFTITGLEEEETKLITWSSKSTKLLISLRRENDSLFSKGKVRKNVAWKRIADQFNSTSTVKVTGEQCSNKWKKLEEKYKKDSEHNSRTGNDRKECEFQDEMTEFFGSNPKIVPAATVSSMEAWKQGQQIIPTMRTRNFLARRHQKRKSEGRQNHPLRR